MGIYIKGMKMPTNCSDCPMCYDMMECTVAEPIINFFKEELEKFDFFTERHPRCPLVSVGPHGRLIDADALRAKMFHEAFETDSPMQKWDSGCWIRYKMFERMEEDASTIIPAEEE